ncbi:MAG: AAA family ATPase [Lawsonella clevelandensis]
MFLRHCELHNFRSWDHLSLDLQPGITVFVGANGQGKTNFLEGINYLATLRSHRVSGDGPLIHEGADSAQLAATAVHNRRELTVALDIHTGKTNQATINTSPCRPRDIVGVISTILFAPRTSAWSVATPLVGAPTWTTSSSDAAPAYAASPATTRKSCGNATHC